MLPDEGQPAALAVQVESGMFLWVVTALAAPLQPGDPAPSLADIAWVEVPDGVVAPTDWAELEGKVVVIDFWATWCGPCVASWPEVERLARSAGPDVVVLAVSDEQAALVRLFLSRRGGAKKLVGAEAEAMSNAWGIGALPTYGVVGPDGRVHAIVGHVPTLELIDAARTGVQPSGERGDVYVSTQTFAPSAGKERDSWSTSTRDTIRGHALDGPRVLELAADLVPPARHVYEVPLPEGRWDVDLSAPANLDINELALARIGEAWGVQITREPVTVEALVLDGRLTSLPASSVHSCSSKRTRARLALRACGPDIAAYWLESHLGIPVVVEGMPAADSVDWILDWDRKDPVGAVTASLIEQGFDVRTEARSVNGLVVRKRDP